jgi:transposase
MRGADAMQEALFSFCKLEDFVPSDHPLRPIRTLVDQSLKRLDGLFNTIYADSGRASIAPEKLIRALLLQVFYSVRSERQLMEQIRYNLLFRWFVGLAIDDSVWDHSVFSKNRDRLIEHEVVEAFFAEVMTLADKADLLSKEHFSVDGTLIQAWASHKSFKPREGSDDDQDPGGSGRNAQADWKGKPRSNDTHASTTDPDARLYRKSKEHGGRAGLPGPCADGEPLRAHRWSHGHAG